jgi:serine/threonine-protein kinase RsbW
MSANHRETIEVTIPSRTEHLSIVNRVTEEIADQLALGDEDRNALATSVIEAATNAIQHGNRNDAKKKVSVRYVVTPNKLEVIVKDQGSGFDPDAVADPLRPENLLRERGRGIFIIRAFMDQVRFSQQRKNGMIVRLVKYLQTTPAEKEARG